MKLKIATICLVFGTLLTPMLAHADGDADRKHPLTFVENSVITTKIKARLADEKMSTLKHIKVDTDAKGMVVLSGNVGSQEEAGKAVSIARATEGVKSVTNELRIKKDD